MLETAEGDWVPLWPRLCAIVAGIASLLAVYFAVGLRHELGNWPLLVPLGLAGLGVIFMRASRLTGVLAAGCATFLLCSTFWVTVAPPKGLSLETAYFVELFRTPFGWLGVIGVAIVLCFGAYSILINWRYLTWM